jgi:hypothetical protein
MGCRRSEWQDNRLESLVRFTAPSAVVDLDRPFTSSIYIIHVLHHFASVRFVLLRFASVCFGSLRFASFGNH